MPDWVPKEIRERYAEAKRPTTYRFIDDVDKLTERIDGMSRFMNHAPECEKVRLGDGFITRGCDCGLDQFMKECGIDV